MDDFSWSDSLRAAFSFCLPCLRHSSTAPVHDAVQPLHHADELEGLLAEVVDTDTEAETLSLHSNPSNRRRRQPARKRRGQKPITLFGYNLFGKPPIRLPDDDDDDEDLNNLLNSRRRKRRTPETISSATLDSDAAPLDSSAIDGLSSAELQQRALAAAEEDRQLKEERRRSRKERKELKKVARALAAGGMGNEEFEGFQGSGDAYPHLPGPFQGPSRPTSIPRDKLVEPVDGDADIDAAGADLGGELYVRRSTPDNSNGSDSRSRTSASSQLIPNNVSTPHATLPNPRLSSVPLSSSSHPPPERREKRLKSRSSASTSQSLSLPSPGPSPFPDDNFAFPSSPPPSYDHEGQFPAAGYGFPSTGLSESAQGFGVRAKSRDIGAFLARRGNA